MNADDLLREAISTAVDEILADNGNPDDEVQRLMTMVESGFWTIYNDRKPDVYQFDGYAKIDITGDESRETLGFRAADMLEAVACVDTAEWVEDDPAETGEPELLVHFTATGPDRETVSFAITDTAFTHIGLGDVVISDIEEDIPE